MSTPSVRRFLPLLLGAGALAVVAIAEPTLLTSTLRSPRALALIVVLVVAIAVGGRLLSRRFGPKVAMGARLAGVAIIAVVLVAPALRQTTVEEDFPVDVATAAAKGEPAATSAPSADANASASADEPQPVLVTSGQLAGINHHATGTVAVFRLADGSHVVRFEDVDIRNSPDPVLYLLPGRDQKTRDGGTEVTKLKATKGSFTHELPAGFDVNRDFTVFIWCDRFTTPIANADQRPV